MEILLNIREITIRSSKNYNIYNNLDRFFNTFSKHCKFSLRIPFFTNFTMLFKNEIFDTFDPSIAIRNIH